MSEVLSTVERFNAASDEMKAARAAYIASLPIATAAEAAAVVFCAREIEISKQDMVEVAKGLNKSFRLSEEQADQVNAAKAEHKVLINTPAIKEEAVAMVSASRLRSYKLRLNAKGRTVVTVSGVL